MKLVTRSTATGLLALGLTFGMGATAFATDDPGPVPQAPSEGLPESGKGRCEGAIKRRVVHLAVWSAHINLRKNLTPAQKGILIGQMTTTSNGLLNTALPAVQSAANKIELRAACKAVLTDYRVYLVVHPRVFLTAAAWGWQPRIDELQAKALALFNAGKDTAIIDALLAHAEGLAGAIPGHLAGISHGTYNADPAGTKILFNTARGELKTITHDVREAAKMIKKLSKKK